MRARKKQNTGYQRKNHALQTTRIAGKKLFYFQTFHLQTLRIDDSPDLILRRLPLGLKFIRITYNAKENIKFVSKSKNSRKISWKITFSNTKTRQIYPISKKTEKNQNFENKEYLSLRCRY